MYSIVARIRSFYRSVLHRRRLDADVESEMRFHIDMQAQRLVRERGLPELEARRQAAIAFGGVQQHKELAWSIRGVRWVAGVSLDLKLGLRMLGKHRGLALVGGFGMAIAIAIATVAFGVISAFVDPTLPIPDGDRLVSIQKWDARQSVPDRHALYDFRVWREKLTSVKELGAARILVENLADDAHAIEAVPLAEMTAASFRATRIRPFLGRQLVDADEVDGAPPVAVIGYTLWQRRFEGDPLVIGRRVQIGGEQHTIVGVMPKGFAFPVNQTVWTPLHIRAVQPDSGPEIYVFGRLADGASVDGARSELATVDASLAAEHPKAYASKRAQLLPYTYPFLDLNSPATASWLKVLRTFVMIILIYVCANVAIVVYARTAARDTEFVVRTALGASRWRIIAQLLCEAFALSCVAGVVGIALAAAALREANTLELGTNGLPFWMHFGLTTGTVVYVTWLTILGAAVIGLIPALNATGRDVQSRIRAVGAGASRLRLGRSWSVLIIGQVAMTVMLLPIAMFSFRTTSHNAFAEAGFPTKEYVTTPLYLDDVTRRGAFAPEDATRYALLQQTLIDRLRAQPWVADAFVSETVPGGAERATVVVDHTAGGETNTGKVPASTGGEVVGVNRIGPRFFDGFGVARLAGRDFRDDDTRASSRTAIVNRSFVREILGGTNALGRRVREVARAGDDTTTDRWFEIVGVVEDLQYPDSDVPPAAVYFPLTDGLSYPINLVVRTRGPAAATVATQLRRLTATVDPTVRTGEIATLYEARQQEQLVWRVVSFGIGFLTLSVLLLSAAGIYALMSFTVTKQRREIGIRTALGAPRNRLLRAVFYRSGTQVLGGLAAGVVLALGIDLGLSGGELLRGEGVVLVPLAGVLMALVGLTAAAGPARRALRVEPTDALREP